MFDGLKRAYRAYKGIPNEKPEHKVKAKPKPAIKPLPKEVYDDTVPKLDQMDAGSGLRFSVVA
ncbi:MAG: hypothetical protein QW404_03990, partial [Candidatus Nanoarchaeia archaeon]